MFQSLDSLESVCLAHELRSAVEMLNHIRPFPMTPFRTLRSRFAPLGFSKDSGACLFALLLGIVATHALAQGQGGGSGNPGSGQGQGGGGNGQGESQGKSKGKPSISDRPVVEPREAQDSGSTDKSKGKPESPGRPDRVEPLPEVKSLVNRFQQSREVYLREQRELKLRLKDAPEEEREAIRQQMKDALERWKEQHRQFVQETRERAQQLKNELHPDLGRVIDKAVDEGRGK